MARKTQTLQVVQDAVVERMVVAAISRVGVLVPPWAVLGLLIGIAAISHHLWGKPPAVVWATMAGTLAAITLSGLTWMVSHQRNLLGRAHSTATALFAVLWFTVATYTGVGAAATLFAMFFGGGLLALCWNVRAVIRLKTVADGGPVADPLAFLFDRGKASFGLGGARVRTTDADDFRVKGTMALPPGEKIADDAIKNAPYMASGMKLPPGSVNVAIDKDDASKALITVSDPRVMERPLPWPGPSRPGASRAEPLRPGLYQDMTEVQHAFVGHHLQLMGMIGSGKSIGGAWNYLAEIVSRRDSAVFGIDISKADQTLGPCEEGLHGVAYTKARAVKLIRAMHAEIPKRTAWLSAHGYQKWVTGCGLLYWDLWVEEYSKLHAALDPDDQEKLEEIVKEIRSAGGSVEISLQRSDYTQAPTLVRSQMAKLCFGLADDDDVKFGTTSRQRKAGVSPEDWANTQPGMAYLDAPGISTTHYAMPLRTYAWGVTDKDAQAAMRAHAAAFPAAAKTGDEFTRRLCAALTDAQATPHTGPAGPARVAFAMPPAAATSYGPAEAAEDPGTGPTDGHDDGPTTDIDDQSADDFAALLVTAAELVITTQFASAVMLQRKLRITRGQCLRVMEALERRRIIGAPGGGNGARQVLITSADAKAVLDELKADGDAVSQYVRTEDPSPEITAGPDDPIIDDADDPLETAHGQRADGQAPKLSPEAARLVVHDWLRHRVRTDRPTFTAGDPEFRQVREQTGHGRPWGYKVLKELVAIGVLRRESGGTTTVYAIEDLGPLGDPGDVAA